MTSELWNDNGQRKAGPEPEGSIYPSALEEQGVRIKLLLIDYHYNYWRLRNRIEEQEGTVYSLEETLGGKVDEISLGDDPPF